MKLTPIYLFGEMKFTGVLIGLTAIAASVGCADLQNADTAVINGILQNVDSVSGEVTVQLKDGTTTTFNLEDVDVEALQAIAGSAVLQAGDEVELTLDDDDSVTSLTPSTAKTEGTVVNVDLDASTVTIDAENGVHFTVIVEANTEIKAKGRGSSTSDITELIPGLNVKVNYDPETSVASKIQFRRQGLGGDDENDKDDEDDNDENDVKGIVTGIDTDAHTITLNDEKGDEFTFTVMASTEIDDDGPVAFGAIQPGYEIEIKFNPQTMEATEIEIAEADEADEDDDGDETDEDDDGDEDDDKKD